MKYNLILSFILFSFISSSYAQNKVLFFQTDWGKQTSWEAYCQKAKESGYDGLELWLPNNGADQITLKQAVKKYNLKLIFLNGTNKGLPIKESLEAFKKNLEVLLSWNPVLINSHTGSDFFTEDENLLFIEAANELSIAHNIPIYHETHRGRFSFNFVDTIKYLEQSPNLKLTLDISHWMVVHESLLEGKDELLKLVIERSNHIHARIGHAEGPQVNDPAAPEWQSALNRHLDIWEKVIKKGWKEHNGVFTVTTEFGPPNYMPTLPYTKLPVSDQWKANEYMMKKIKERLNLL